MKRRFLTKVISVCCLVFLTYVISVPATHAVYFSNLLSSVSKAGNITAEVIGTVDYTSLGIYCFFNPQTAFCLGTTNPAPNARLQSKVSNTTVVPSTTIIYTSPSPVTIERIIERQAAAPQGLTQEQVLALIDARTPAPVYVQGVGNIQSSKNYDSEIAELRTSIQNTNITNFTSTTTFNALLNFTSASGTDLYLADSSPVDTNHLLYSTAGSLYWNGSLVAGGGIGNWTSLSGNVYRNTGNVGIGTTTPQQRLVVAGNVYATGTVTAAQFFGDGSQLTGITSFSTSTTRNVFSSSEAGLSYSTSTGIFSLTSGYTIPLTASTSEWAIALASTSVLSGFYNTPSSRIGAGSNLSWTGNTLSVSGLTTSNVSEGSNLYFTDGRAINALTGQNISLFTNDAGYLTSYTETDTLANVTGRGATTATQSTFSGGLLSGLGTALLPSYSFSGDTNTGMWSPAADTIAFSEGGVESMRIDSSGRLGVGATPLGIFDVSGSSAATDLVAFDTSRSISMINRNTTTNNAQGIVLRSQSTNGTIQSGVKLLAVNTARTAAGLTSDFAILTNTDGTISEKMRVLSNGNVGIGTTTPAQTLSIQGTAGINPFQIASSTGASLMTMLQNGNIGIGATTPTRRLEVNAIGVAFDGAMFSAIYAIGNGGNGVRIGTGSNGQGSIILESANNLTINATAGLSSSGFVNHTTFSSTFIASVINSTPLRAKGFSAGQTADIFHVITNTDTVLFNVTAAGNVGIGSTTPSARLTVSTGINSTNDAFSVNGLVNTLAIDSNGTLRHRLTDGSRRYTLATNGSNDFNLSDGITQNDGGALLLSPGYTTGGSTGVFLSSGGGGSQSRFSVFVNSTNTPSMVIRAGGNVGIGTTTPTFPLVVQTAGTDVARFVGSGGSAQCTVVAGTGWSCTSDERMKQNITALSVSTLESLIQLQGVSYNWISGDTATKQIGFSAQDVEKIFPDLVRTDSGGNKSLLYAQFTPYIIESVKALNVKLESIQSLMASTTLAQNVTGGGSWAGNFVNALVGKFQKVQVEDGIEMKDKATNKTYCVTIVAGEFSKVEGECSNINTNLDAESAKNSEPQKIEDTTVIMHEATSTPEIATSTTTSTATTTISVPKVPVISTTTPVIEPQKIISATTSPVTQTSTSTTPLIQ